MMRSVMMRAVMMIMIIRAVMMIMMIRAVMMIVMTTPRYYYKCLYCFDNRYFTIRTLSL